MEDDWERETDADKQRQAEKEVGGGRGVHIFFKLTRLR